MENTNKVQISLAAIDKSYIKSIPEPTENTFGRDYVYWGSDNKYPEYLYELFNDCNTLRTIILGTADYVQGDDVLINNPKFAKEVNKKGDTARQFVQLLAKDYLTYGGFAFQVIRDTNGDINELYWLDYRYVRTSKMGNIIYYSEDFSKRYARQSKIVKYPSFFDEAKAETSVVYFKNEKSHVYSSPVYIGALKACEIERNIDEYHLSSLLNGFAPSYILSFNNGIPSDEEKAQIEADVESKFCGAANAGTFLMSFANGKENALEVTKLDVEDFGEKYKAAADRARQQIFTAFRAQPCLFGLVADQSKGFSKVEYSEAFDLYNRTVVRSIQTLICDEIDKVFGQTGIMTITPFSIDEDNKEEVVE